MGITKQVSRAIVDLSDRLANSVDLDPGQQLYNDDKSRLKLMAFPIYIFMIHKRLDFKTIILTRGQRAL